MHPRLNLCKSHYSKGREIFGRDTGVNTDAAATQI